jgi:hypothetical protein
MIRINRKIDDWLYPELKLFSTAEQRDKALRHARENSWRADVLVPIFLIFALGVAASALLSTFGVPVASRGAMRGWIQLAQVVGFFSLMVPYGKHVRKHLRRSLNLDRPRVCVMCGYSLEQSQSRTCPECGAEN